MKPKIAFVVLLVLLVGMSVTGQSAGNTLVVTFDTANDPLCTAQQSTDCVAGARIFYRDAQGNEVRAPGADIAAIAFTVVSGTQVSGSVAVPAIPGQRYGRSSFTARMVAKDGSGAEVLSDPMDPSLDVAVVRRPPRPAGFSVK